MIGCHGLSHQGKPCGHAASHETHETILHLALLAASKQAAKQWHPRHWRHWDNRAPRLVPQGKPCGRAARHEDHKTILHLALLAASERAVKQWHPRHWRHWDNRVPRLVPSGQAVRARGEPRNLRDDLASRTACRFKASGQAVAPPALEALG
jgi:hypothetical protein